MAYSKGKELRRKIRTLIRRRDFLGQRLASAGRPSPREKGDWDRAEYNALSTAIELMEEAYNSLPSAEKSASDMDEERKK